MTPRHTFAIEGHVQLDAKLQDVVRRIQKEYKDDNFSIEDASPLPLEILAKSLPPKFKLQSLEKYDGKSNPISHVANFKTTIMLQDISDYLLLHLLLHSG